MKAVIAINSADGEIRSGQISDLDGYDYYLLKFGNADFNSAELEMTYYDLAIKAGINMMHCRAFSHFNHQVLGLNLIAFKQVF